MELYDKMQEDAYAAAAEICEVAGLCAGQILVVGCSTSEVCGGRIGSSSSPEAARAIFDGIMRACAQRGVTLAAQCCEHLNRAIVIERAAAGGLTICSAVPVPKAGGAFAAAAYENFENPVVVEEIFADAGLDIGGVLIGMHLRRVAVPVRLCGNQIGAAMVFAARTRPKFIGGERAVYSSEIL